LDTIHTDNRNNPLFVHGNCFSGVNKKSHQISRCQPRLRSQAAEFGRLFFCGTKAYKMAFGSVTHSSILFLLKKQKCGRQTGNTLLSVSALVHRPQMTKSVPLENKHTTTGESFQACITCCTPQGSGVESLTIFVSIVYSSSAQLGAVCFSASSQRAGIVPP
jgi:hypothetical protein